MRGSDASFEQLREAITALADRHAGALVAEAESEARERVRARLVDAIEAALLDRSVAELAALHLGSSRPPSESAESPRASEPSPLSGADAESRGATEPAPGPIPAPAPRPAPVQDSPAPAEVSPEAPAEQGEATYVFGVVDTAPQLDELPRFEGHPLRMISLGDIDVIAATVALSEFGEQALERNLEDLEWIERTARAHETVIAALAEHATVVPMRLCTIYRDDEQLQSAFGERAEEFAETLERLTGRTEWGIKLIAAPGALETLAERRGDQAAAEPEGLSPGLAYLDRKQRQQRARGDIEAIASELADGAHERLAATAEAARLNKLQARELGGHSGDMILNGAYLVGDREFDRFEDTVAALRGELAADEVEVELTGPWPAYNFAAPDNDDSVVVVG